MMALDYLALGILIGVALILFYRITLRWDRGARRSAVPDRETAESPPSECDPGDKASERLLAVRYLALSLDLGHALPAGPRLGRSSDFRHPIQGLPQYHSCRGRLSWVLDDAHSPLRGMPSHGRAP